MYFKSQGITLLEIMLVLAIASAILVLSLRTYFSYRRSGDIAQLQSNVNMLFTAMSAYYKANCANPQSPLSKYYSEATYPVTYTDLAKRGYLVLPANGEMPVNPLVDTHSTQNGYILQFNQYHINNALPSRTETLSPPGTSAKVGSIVLWQMQVAIAMLDANTASQYQNILGATCVSTASGNGVLPCSSGGETGGNYVVFVRGPSQPSAGNLNSIYWYINPSVRLFQQLYTTDPMLILIDQTQTKSQYYLCGS